MNKDDLRTTIVAILVMAMCFAAAFCCSCSACNERHHPQKIGVFELRDQLNADNIFAFEFECVENAQYYIEDLAFVLEYNDADSFDYDALADKTGRTKWYGDFVYVDIENNLVSEFLEDLADYVWNKSLENYGNCDELSKKYAVVQYKVEGDDFLWILIKVPENFEWKY